MIKRLYDSCTFELPGKDTEISANDNPPEKQWRVMGENNKAARRALYAAKAQAGLNNPKVILPIDFAILKRSIVSCPVS